MSDTQPPMTWQGKLGIGVLFGTIALGLMLIAYAEHHRTADTWPGEAPVKPVAQIPGM
jgi:hypothetical protein